MGDGTARRLIDPPAPPSTKSPNKIIFISLAKNEPSRQKRRKDKRVYEIYELRFLSQSALSIDNVGELLQRSMNSPQVVAKERCEAEAARVIKLPEVHRARWVGP